jgi:phosphate-selective porin
MSGTRLTGVLAPIAAALVSLAGPPLASAQDATGPNVLRPSGMLRTGFEVEPADADRADGFIVYDARLALTGVVGHVFDFTLGVEYDRDDAGIDLLDAIITFPLSGEAVRADLGGFRSPVSREATADKDMLPFVERSQSALALAPGRQLGLQVRGTALDERLRVAGGLFNGNGLRLENDDKAFLVAGRAAYNNVGEVEFPEDFVVAAGLSAAWSSDSALIVLPVEGRTGAEPEARRLVSLEEFEGDRIIWGADARLAYEGWTLAVEYLRTDYDPEVGESLHADGVTVDLRHALWGLFDVGGRYDSFTPAVGFAGEPPRASRFLVLGLGVAPGLFARAGLQYAIGIDSTTRGVGSALDGTNTAPPLTDDQFLLFLQLAF